MAGGRHKKCCYRRGCIMRDNQIGGNSLSLLPKHVARGSVACAGLIMFHLTVIWTDILKCVIFSKTVFIAIGFHSASETFRKSISLAWHVGRHFAVEYVYK